MKLRLDSETRAPALLLRSFPLARAQPLCMPTSIPGPLVFKARPAPVMALDPSVALKSMVAPSSDKGRGLALAVAGTLALSVLAAAGYGYRAWQNEQAEQRIVEAGFELDSDGLLQVITQGHVELLQAYERLGFDVKTLPRSIEAAVVSGQPDMLAAVLAAGAELQNEPNAESLLLLAVSANQPQLMDDVLKLVPIRSDQVAEVLNEVLKQGHGGLLKPLAVSPEVQSFKDASGHSLIHFAVLAGDVALLAELHELKAIDLSARNQTGQTALHFIADEAKPEMAQWLMDQGLDPMNADQSGNHPLNIALQARDEATLTVMAKHSEAASRWLTTDHIEAVLEQGMVSVVQALLDRGWSPHVSLSNGMTPLAMAAGGNHLNLMSVLFERGVAVNATFVINDVAGVTALMLAAVNGHEEAVRALLTQGAQRDLTASNGVTAASLADGQGHSAVLRALE